MPPFVAVIYIDVGRCIMAEKRPYSISDLRRVWDTYYNHEKEERYSQYNVHRIGYAPFQICYDGQNFEKYYRRYKI